MDDVEAPPLSLSGVKSAIEFHLDRLKYRETSAHGAPVKTGFAFAEVPDWALKQWIEAINDLSITKGE